MSISQPELIMGDKVKCLLEVYKAVVADAHVPCASVFHYESIIIHN